MSKRVAVYCRISKDREGKAEGVARQEALCRERAEREGWEVVRVHTDNDVSASKANRKPRPAYAAMLESARRGEIDVIVAYSNSRLTRRMRELEDLIELHEQTGVVICTVVSGDDDLSTASGRTVARIKASVDAGEAEQTRERLLHAQAARRAVGDIRTRRAFGWDGDNLIEAEAEAIRQAMSDVLKGTSTSAIARRWNSEGVASVTGVPWQQRRVVEVLTRWRNCGAVVHLGDPVEGVTGRWEPLCDRATLERVRTILLDPSRRTNGPGRRPSALLSTVAICGTCGRGRTMVASKARARDGAERFNYRCSGALSTTGDKCYAGIKRETLDNAVLHEVRRIIALGGASTLMPTEEERATLDGWRKQRAEIAVEERELGASMGRGGMSVAALTLALEGAAARRADLDQRIAEVERRYLFADLYSAILPDGKVSIEAAAEVGKRLKALPVEQLREVVRATVDVTVMPGRSDDRVKVVPRHADAVGT